MTWLIGIFIGLILFNIKALHYIWKVQQLHIKEEESSKCRVTELEHAMNEVKSVMRDMTSYRHARTEVTESPETVEMEEAHDRMMTDHLRRWAERAAESSSSRATHEGLMVMFRRMLRDNTPAGMDTSQLIEGFEEVLNDFIGGGSSRTEQEDEEQEAERRPSRRLNIERE